MSDKFGQIIKAKLAERRMSQRWLAQMTLISPTYINYIVRGRGPKSTSKPSQPSIGMVKEIARVLGIPIEEALEAAGYDPKVALSRMYTLHRDTAPASVNEPVSHASGDTHVFDVAYKAAVEAVKGLQNPGPSVRSGSQPRELTIDVPGLMRVVLYGDVGRLMPPEIELYRQAFIGAYEAVGNEIEKARGKDIETDTQH